MQIPIEILKQIDSISSFKVLIFFYENSNNINIIQASIRQIAKATGLSRSTVEIGIRELIKLGFVSKDKVEAGETSKFRLLTSVTKIMTHDTTIETPTEEPSVTKIETVTKIMTPTNPVISGFQLALGAKKKRKQENNKDINNINNNIYVNTFNHLDFNTLDFNIFYNKDINSTSLVNANMYLTEKELGSLASRVFDWAYPLLTLDRKPDGKWFARQKGFMKQLLFKWRTEQVMASVLYWTTISPNKNGMSNLLLLNYRGKMEKALDYYKTEYVANEHEYNKEELINKAVKAKETLLREEQEKKLAIEKAREMQNMTDEKASEVANDVMADILGSIKIDFRR